MIDKMNIGRDSTRKIAGSAQKFADKFVTSEDFQSSGAYSGPIVISKGINYSMSLQISTTRFSFFVTFSK